MHHHNAKKKIAKSIRLIIDQAKSMRYIVRDIIEAAYERQRKYPGADIADVVMKHLVGAKLQLLFPEAKIEYKSFFDVEAKVGREGDFLVGDTAIHVTTAPTEAIVCKCCDNLADNIRPVIITTASGVGGAYALARNAEIVNRIDILEIEQFITTNVYFSSGFIRNKRRSKVAELVESYNRIVDACKTDPNLKISIA